MSDSDSNLPRAGEHLPADDAERVARALDKVRQQGLTAQVASRISRSVFFNRLQERRIRAAETVIRAERELMGELIEHQRTRGRLLDLETELEAERLERQTRLTLARKSVEIAEKEAELELKRLNRALEGFNGDAQDRRYREQLEAEERRAAFDVERRILSARKNLALTRELYKERDRMIAEVTRGRTEGLSEDEEREIENIRDLFQRVIDEI